MHSDRIGEDDATMGRHFQRQLLLRTEAIVGSSRSDDADDPKRTIGAVLDAKVDVPRRAGKQVIDELVRFLNDQSRCRPFRAEVKRTGQDKKPNTCGQNTQKPNPASRHNSIPVKICHRGPSARVTPARPFSLALSTQPRPGPGKGFPPIPTRDTSVSAFSIPTPQALAGQTLLG